MYKSEAKKNYYPKTSNTTHKRTVPEQANTKYIYVIKKKPQANNFFSSLCPVRSIANKIFVYLLFGSNTYQQEQEHIFYLFSVYLFRRCVTRDAAADAAASVHFLSIYMCSGVVKDDSHCLFLLDSRMKLLNVYFAHFDTIFLGFPPCYKCDSRARECVCTCVRQWRSPKYLSKNNNLLFR